MNKKSSKFAMFLSTLFILSGLGGVGTGIGFFIKDNKNNINFSNSGSSGDNSSNGSNNETGGNNSNSGSNGNDSNTNNNEIKFNNSNLINLRN
ncbi:MAG: hypothetical protein K2I49_03030, partial [Ureaplasma sp.]|nr:hypothetical protein [Ureaplasma sp.]